MVLEEVRVGVVAAGGLRDRGDDVDSLGRHNSAKERRCLHKPLIGRQDKGGARPLTEQVPSYVKNRKS